MERPNPKWPGKLHNKETPLGWTPSYVQHVSISSFRFILEVLPPRKLITYSLSKSVLTCDVFYFLLKWSLFKGQMYKFVHFQRPKIPYPLFSFGVLTFGNRRSTFCWTIHSLLQATCMRWRADTGDTTLHEFPCFFPGFEGYLLCNVSNCVSLASKWCFGWHIQGSHTCHVLCHHYRWLCSEMLGHDTSWYLIRNNK